MKKSIIFHMAACLMVINLIMLTFFLPIANTQAVTSKKATLNHKHIILNVGEKQKLSIKNYNKLIKWKSSNKKVATVSKKGVVKAIKKGTANISAKIKGKKYICKVTVKAENITTKSQNTSNGTNINTILPILTGKTNATPLPTEEPDVNPNPTTTPRPAHTPSPTATPLKDYDYYPFTTPKSDNYISGQLSISLITNCTEEEVLEIAAASGVKNVESVELVFSELQYMYYINLTTKTKESVVDAIHLIQEHPLVYYAIPVYNSFMIDDWE